MIEIGLLGARGRMGRTVARVLAADYGDRARLAARPEPGQALSGLLDCDVIVDFSRPEGTLALLRAGRAGMPPVASGTTGWDEEQRAELRELVGDKVVLLASNFSTGIGVLHRILAQAGPLLERLGYEAVLRETHHRHKLDAPSGTALALCRTLRPEDPGSIQTHAIRAGEVVGEHECTFFGAADRITIGHTALDRAIFARGALDVALWLAGSELRPGLHHMDAYFDSLM